MATKTRKNITTIEEAEKEIRKAYRKATKEYNGGIRIQTLRNTVAVDTRLMEKTLAAMAGQDGVHFRAEADQKTLNFLDWQPRMGGIILGGTMRHNLFLERR
ncbi:hypothetical protein [Nocardia sp. NBC_00511]|uniref:hypothetical protein n=1 Tax=Nocardia sp. NBC_00511 TaxID=2903591 RepID=UPI0030E3AC67